MTGDNIRKEITINATIEKVWAVLTQPIYIQQWIIDTPIRITSGWKAGSEIVFEGDLHGLPFKNKGTILQFHAPHIFQYTSWSTLSEHADVPENYSVITFELQPVASATKLLCTQSNFATDVIYKHFNFYWNTALDLIRKTSEQ